MEAELWQDQERRMVRARQLPERLVEATEEREQPLQAPLLVEVEEGPEDTREMAVRVHLQEMEAIVLVAAEAEAARAAQGVQPEAEEELVFSELELMAPEGRAVHLLAQEEGEGLEAQGGRSPRLAAVMEAAEGAMTVVLPLEMVGQGLSCLVLQQEKFYIREEILSTQPLFPEQPL